MSQSQRIETPKLVLKAAESVWGSNKYFVLACSQRQYLKVRGHFRQRERDLLAAYEVLNETETQYKILPSRELPELTNALYHVMGYFKKLFSEKEKTTLTRMIKENPENALCYLEKQTFFHEVDYLLSCRLWEQNRRRPFNEVPISLKVDGHSYIPYSWLWCGDYLIPKT